MSLVSMLADRTQWYEKKTHRYDEMNEAVSQFPVVKTVNPPVKRIMTHATSANQLVYP